MLHDMAATTDIPYDTPASAKSHRLTNGNSARSNTGPRGRKDANNGKGARVTNASDQAVEAHLRHLHRRNLRPNTIVLRKAVLRRLQQHIWPIQLLDATTDDCRHFLDRLAEPRSRATELTQLRGFYLWAFQEGLIQCNPTEKVERPRVQRTLPRPIDDTDLAFAIKNAPERIRPFLVLAAYGGLRAFDIANLRGENLLLHREPPIIVMETKGGKMRSIPVSTYLAGELQAMHLPRKGWCFTRRDGILGPITPHLVSKLTNDYLHSIGIDDTLHSLRHWFATKVYAASGRDLRATQELLGHESPVSTAIYTFVDPDALLLAVERIGQVESTPA